MFCVTGAILWMRVNASVSFSRGRRSTLQCGVLHLRGRRSILWRVQSAIFHESHCQGCANVTQWQKSWQAQHLATAWKTCGSLAKSNTFGGL